MTDPSAFMNATHVIAESSSWSIFWPTLWATLAAGAVIAVIVYLVFDKRLQSKDERAHSREVVKNEVALRKVALETALAEFATAAGVLPFFRVHTTESTGPRKPGFYLNGLALLLQAHVMATINPRAVYLVLTAYNWAEEYNKALDEAYEMLYSPSRHVLRVAVAVARQPSADAIENEYNKLLDHRLNDLRIRLDALLPRLHQAIDAIETELGRSSSEGPAASRNWVAKLPAGVRANLS
jgi:hypothetical protein